MANKNLVQFGLSRLAIAPITATTPYKPPTFGTPIPIPGARSLSMDAEVAETEFYADNRKYWGTFTDNGYTGDFEVARIPDEVYVAIFDWYIDSLGGLVEVANGQKKNFALLGQFEGDAHAGRFAVYNNAAGKPSSEAATIEDTAEPQTQTLEYTATPIYLEDGETLVTKYTLFDDPSNPEAHAAYNAWFDAVTMPLPKEPAAQGAQGAQAAQSQEPNKAESGYGHNEYLGV